MISAMKLVNITNDACIKTCIGRHNTAS